MFVFLTGNRVGSRPLPPRISSADFDKLVGVV